MQKSEQMEPFVVSFFEQMMNEAFVSLKSAYAPKMTTHTSDHTGDTGDGFQKDEPIHPPDFIHSRKIISGSGIVDSPENFDGKQSHFIGKLFGLDMGDSNFLCRFLGVDIMLKSMGFAVENAFMFG
jgi:hypothetical protein